MKGLGGKVGGWLGQHAFVFAFLGIAGLWLYTHLFPASLGTCREVPLNIGKQATVRGCQAYATSDFVVPLALVVLAVLLLSSGDIEFTIPGFGTVKRNREKKETAQAVEVLKQETGAATLDERGERFLETLLGPPESAKDPPP